MAFDSMILSIIFFTGWILMVIGLVRAFVYHVKHLEKLNDALFEYEYNEYGNEILKTRVQYYTMNRRKRDEAIWRILKMDIPKEHSKIKWYQRYLKVTVLLLMLSIIICFPVFLSAFIIIAVFF